MLMRVRQFTRIDSFKRLSRRLDRTVSSLSLRQDAGIPSIRDILWGRGIVKNVKVLKRNFFALATETQKHRGPLYSRPALSRGSFLKVKDATTELHTSFCSSPLRKFRSFLCFCVSVASAKNISSRPSRSSRYPFRLASLRSQSKALHARQ